jgi:hypothetical protein
LLFLLVYILINNMAVLRLISRVENWLLNFMRECLIGEV